MGISKVSNGNNINDCGRILYLVLCNDRVNLDLRFIC